MSACCLGTKVAIEAPKFDQQTVTQALSLIFSWIILLPIGVIVTGKFLSQPLKFEAGPGLQFRIPIKGVLAIESNGAEVILGFACYLVSLGLLGAVFGSSIQPWVKARYGIDPGQFNALGFASSIFSVAISSVVFLVARIPRNPNHAKLLQERNAQVERIARAKTGIDPKKLPEVKE